MSDGLVIDVVVVVAIGDEVDAAAVRGPIRPPLGSDILWVLLAHQQRGVTGFRVDQQEPPVLNIQVALVH